MNTETWVARATAIGAEHGLEVHAMKDGQFVVIVEHVRTVVKTHKTVDELLTAMAAAGCEIQELRE